MHGRTSPTPVLAIALMFALLAPAALASADDGPRERTYLGDATSRWFHAGAGLGAIEATAEDATYPIGRLVLGGGFYTFGFYTTGGLELSGAEPMPFQLRGVGGLGVHIPIPVVHPMFGFKVGGGFASICGEPTPLTTIGGQFGAIVRQFDGNVGIRVLVEPALTHYPMLRMNSSEVFLTVALVL